MRQGYWKRDFFLKSVFLTMQYASTNITPLASLDPSLTYPAFTLMMTLEGRPGSG
jgi:hypothetical protein